MTNAGPEQPFRCLDFTLIQFIWRCKSNSKCMHTPKGEVPWQKRLDQPQYICSEPRQFERSKMQVFRGFLYLLMMIQRDSLYKKSIGYILKCSVLSGPSWRGLIKAKYLKVGLLRDEEVDLRHCQVLVKTSQELRMLSSVNLYFQVNMIVKLCFKVLKGLGSLCFCVFKKMAH